jgi:hypothetical protein
MQILVFLFTAGHHRNFAIAPCLLDKILNQMNFPRTLFNDVHVAEFSSNAFERSGIAVANRFQQGTGDFPQQPGGLYFNGKWVADGRVSVLVRVVPRHVKHKSAFSANKFLLALSPGARMGLRNTFKDLSFAALNRQESWTPERYSCVAQAALLGDIWWRIC